MNNEKPLSEVLSNPIQIVEEKIPQQVIITFTDNPKTGLDIHVGFTPQVTDEQVDTTDSIAIITAFRFIEWLKADSAERAARG